MSFCTQSVYRSNAAHFVIDPLPPPFAGPSLFHEFCGPRLSERRAATTIKNKPWPCRPPIFYPVINLPVWREKMPGNSFPAKSVSRMFENSFSISVGAYVLNTPYAEVTLAAWIQRSQDTWTITVVQTNSHAERKSPSYAGPVHGEIRYLFLVREPTDSF